MKVHPSQHGPVRFAPWVITVPVAMMIGAVCLQAVSPVGSIVAECFDGQTLDPSTGTCPQEPSTTNSAGNLTNQAVEDAVSGNQLDASGIG